MVRLIGRVLAVALGLLSAGTAQAATERRCQSVPVQQIAFRAGSFDAWLIGDKVRAGTSDVGWTAGGCALLEHWVGAVSGDGTALYLHHGGRWHLEYVNSDGATLDLSGNPDGTGGLLFEGRHPDFGGRAGEHRMRFAPEGPDVRQTWHFRPSGAEQWELLVDMIQRRRPTAD
jgi:hypothetical protein